MGHCSDTLCSQTEGNSDLHRLHIYNLLHLQRKYVYFTFNTERYPSVLLAIIYGLPLQHLNSLDDKTATAFLDQPSVELSMNVLQDALHTTFLLHPPAC